MKEETIGQDDIIMYTHDRHRNIVPINISKMTREDLIAYSSLRPIYRTPEEVRTTIEPMRVNTGTGPNDYYYV